MSQLQRMQKNFNNGSTGITPAMKTSIPRHWVRILSDFPYNPDQSSLRRWYMKGKSMKVVVALLRSLVICVLVESKTRGRSPASDPCISVACLNSLVLGLYPKIINRNSDPPHRHTSRVQNLEFGTPSCNWQKQNLFDFLAHGYNWCC